MRAPLYGGITTQQPSDLHEPPLPPPPSSHTCPLSSCLPQLESLNTITQLRKREEEEGGGGGVGGGGFYKGTLMFITLREAGDWGNAASPAYVFPISLVFLSSTPCFYLPLAFFCLFVFRFVLGFFVFGSIFTCLDCC